MKANYHTHCNFCDGKGNPEAYVIEAIERGFKSLGFSSHAPLKEDNDWTMKQASLDNYLNTIDDLKKRYGSRINIYKGMEIDYYPDENRFETFSECNLDYSIGAVHLLLYKGMYYSVDSSPKDFEYVTNEVFGSIEKFVRLYYKTVRDLISQGGFQILGHIDLIKKYNKGNRFFSETESWYIEEVISTLDLLSRKGTIMEVNTGAIARGLQDSAYPSEWILREAFNRDIKICLNSDAHSPENIECDFKNSLEILREVGYEELHTPFEIVDIRR